MSAASPMLARFLTLLLVAVAGLGLDISAAYAQSQNCVRLNQMLTSLDGTGDFRNLEANTQQARDIAAQVQETESAYVRTGCNDQAKSGKTLTRDCRVLAKLIINGRKSYDSLARSVETGNAIAQQREAVLQQMARFACIPDSSATVTQTQRPDRRNLFEQLFDALGGSGDGQGGFRGGMFAGFGDYETVRTVCVRKSDGYYWPISYSTLVEYAPNDAAQCQEQCPGMDVDLYYYDNPGQEPEQMINLYGEAYAALPNAFRYRTEFDRANSCKVAVDYGTITLMAQADGQSRAMIEFGTLSFPLPIRDPRRTSVATVAVLDTAQYLDIPLPRRRPPAPGESAPAGPATPPSGAEPPRIVQFGNKRVRIVGPDTPYVPAAATGT